MSNKVKKNKTQQKNKFKRNETPVIQWISHPFMDRPRTSTLLVLFLIVFSYLLRTFIIGFFRLTDFWFVISMFLLMLSLAPYFIPTKYQFYHDKVIVYYWFYKVERPLSDFGCFYADKLGVMLSTFKRPRRLDAFRGMSVRFSKDQEERETFLKFLDDKIGNRY